MSLAALAGFIFGFGLFLLSILMSTDNIATFFDLPSVLMVLGGTTATAFMGYQHTYVIKAFRAIWWMMKKPKSTRESLNTEIMRLIKWAYLVQQKGLPALENEIKTIKRDDQLLNYCLTMVTSGHKPEDLRSMLETSVESEFERKTVPVQVLKMMASASPAFGMLGTLVGLVVMLQNFGADLDLIGEGLSLALITTLYGVVFARLLFLPAALRLQQKEEIERFRNYMVVEGLIMLAEKKGPRFMQDRLNSFLDPAIHFNIDKQAVR